MSKIRDKELLEKAIKKSLCKAEVLTLLGLKACGSNYKTFDKYVSMYNLDTSHFTGRVWNTGKRFREFGKKLNIETILVENSTYTNTNRLRIRLINEGLKEEKCNNCGLTHWLDNKIPLELDHINGINNDHRIENLRLLCPNCHALTSTYRGKNINAFMV